MIATRELTKQYGRFVALDRCSLQVDHGEILGLLGPNGAGKTTLIRLLLGFLKPTTGEAYIDGKDCRRDSLAIRQMTSYLPGEVRLFRGLRGRDVLRFFAELRGQTPRRACEIAERLELDLQPRVSSMSTGMRQKLAVAAAVAAGTRLIILDEPTSNLDPTARGAVLELVREARDAGSTIVFSSHVLAEVEETCDRVVILRKGRVVHVQPMSALRQQHRIVARLNGPIAPLPDTLASVVSMRHGDHDTVVIDANGALAPVLRWLSTLPLAEVRVDPVGLRTIYDRVQMTTCDPYDLPGAAS